MEDDINIDVRPFRAIFGELDGGNVDEEMTEKIHTVVQECIRTGKKGKVTLILDFAPEGSGQCTVGSSIKAVVPEFKKQPTIMFVDSDSNLTRANPRQRTFGEILNVKQDGETVSVNNDTGEVVSVDRE